MVPDARAAARANKNFLARAIRFLVEEAGIRQVQCRDTGRSSRARLCGPRAEADTAMDPSLWCAVTKDPYLSVPGHSVIKRDVVDRKTAAL